MVQPAMDQHGTVVLLAESTISGEEFHHFRHIKDAMIRPIRMLHVHHTLTLQTLRRANNN